MLRKKLWDFFTRNFDVVALFVNLLLIALAIELHAWGLNFFLFIPLLVLLGVLLWFDYRLKKQHDRRQIRELHNEFVDSLLEAAATSILRVTQASHMRACLMAPIDGRLQITNQYGFSLEEDRDLGICLPMNTGCAGHAWAWDEAVVADLEQALPPGGPNWNLPPEEEIKVRETLKSILSVPVKAGTPYRMMAVLNIDSDDRMADTRFVDKEIQHIAYCFVKVLSSLFDETDYGPAQL